jgi:hypothetical protein
MRDCVHMCMYSSVASGGQLLLPQEAESKGLQSEYFT